MKRFDVKQKITAFLLKEEGKISKKSVLKAGILLGAIAVSAKFVEAHGNHSNAYINTLDENGDCGVDSRLWDGYAGDNKVHTNASHENNLNAKNFFGKLVLGHDNCVETHKNHSVHNSHDSSHSSGADPCSW